MLYSFNSEELQLAKTVAILRSVPKRKRNVRNKKVSDIDDFTIDYVGCLGEIAVAAVSGGTSRTDGSLMGDQGYGDVTLPNGKMIEVKTTLKPNRNLIVSGKDPSVMKADYIVLVWLLTEDSVEIFGWLSREQWLKRHVVLNLGYGPVMSVHYNKMNKGFLADGRANSLVDV